MKEEEGEEEEKMGMKKKRKRLRIFIRVFYTSVVCWRGGIYWSRDTLPEVRPLKKSISSSASGITSLPQQKPPPWFL